MIRHDPATTASVPIGTALRCESGLRSPLQSAVDRVGQRLCALPQEGAPDDDPLRYVLLAPGKRLRARLVCACALLTSQPAELSEPVIAAAAAIELLHEASLIHDDMCDGSSLRRNRPSLAAVVGTRAALHASYLLIGHATRLLAFAGEEKPEAVPLTRLPLLSSGQILELRCADIKSSREARGAYLEVIRGKTAALFEFACRAGAALGGASAKVTEVAAEFGLNLGLAFQILDDARDLEAPLSLGKAGGTDLARGFVTWPVIEFWESGGELPTSELREVEEVEQLRQRILSSGAVLRTREVAAEVLRHARRNLAALPPSLGADSLQPLLHEVTRL